MKKHLIALCLCLVTMAAFSQVTPPPARLKYFGFAIVDCSLDDPNDAPVLTNYINEVDSFSNVAQMCVESHTDTVINRVNLMNAGCVKPILSISKVFIYLANTNGPSGSNYDLYPNYQSRWDSFKVINASVLNPQFIEMLYVCDEPTWNGVDFTELSTICNTIKADFPTIPLATVEAYTMVNQIQVPTTIDYLGFDRYGVYDVSTDASYLAQLDTFESKRSTPNQRIILVFDEQWNSGFWPGGWTPDSMKTVLENYYKLALADTNVVALVGFTWPGIAPGWLGARHLPQQVIDKTVEIGQMIKNNYSMCQVGIADKKRVEVNVYPNPTGNYVMFSFSPDVARKNISLYNNLGVKVKEIVSSEQKIIMQLNEMPAGIYYYKVNSQGKEITSGKLVRE